MKNTNNMGTYQGDYNRQTATNNNMGTYNTTNLTLTGPPTNVTPVCQNK